VLHNQIETAILDVSATAHAGRAGDALPPEIFGAGEHGEQHTPAASRASCLRRQSSGLVLPPPPPPGDRLAVFDMASTMVQTTTFNGIQLPTCDLRAGNRELQVVRSFGMRIQGQIVLM